MFTSASGLWWSDGARRKWNDQLTEKWVGVMHRTLFDIHHDHVEKEKSVVDARELFVLLMRHYLLVVLSFSDTNPRSQRDSWNRSCTSIQSSCGRATSLKLVSRKSHDYSSSWPRLIYMFSHSWHYTCPIVLIYDNLMSITSSGVNIHLHESKPSVHERFSTIDRKLIICTLSL